MGDPSLALGMTKCVGLETRPLNAKPVFDANTEAAAMTYETFCGGIFETNCYLVEAPEGWILFDAPDGACRWLESRQAAPKLLLLTHGHIDHIQDVARIKQRFSCPI